MLVDSKIDFGNKRNLVISSVILVVGIGGAVIKVSESLQIQGMALAYHLRVLLNLILPGRETANENMLEEIESSDKRKTA